jgi:hypothetical protein
MVNADLILGEILICKIRRTNEGWVADSPTTVMRHYGHEHVIEWNVYKTFDDCVAAATKLVPAECRGNIKIHSAKMSNSL